MKINGNLAIGLFWFGVIIFLTLIYLAGWHIDKKNIYAPFCQEKGFEKATDYRILNSVGYKKFVDIECDKKQIFRGLKLEEKCIKSNKWGECQDYRRYVREVNQTNSP